MTNCIRNAFLLASSLLLFAAFTPFAAQSVESPHSELAARVSPNGRAVYPDGKFKWTPEDSAKLRVYGDMVGLPQRSGEKGAFLGDPYVKISPDGQYFYVLSAHGDLKCSCSIQALEMYRASEVTQWLANAGTNKTPQPPIWKIERASDPEKGSPTSFRLTKWADDSSGVLFVRDDSEGKRQLYKVAVATGKTAALTNDPLEVDAFYSKDDAVLHQTFVPSHSGPVPAQIITPAPRNKLGEIELPFSLVPPGREQWVYTKAGKQWILPDEMPISLIKAPWFSPDSTKIVVASAGSGSNAERFVLLDPNSKKVRTLIHRPKPQKLGDGSFAEEIQPEVYWLDTGPQIILVNTDRPKKPIDSRLSGGSADASSGYIVAFDTETDKTQILEPLVSSDGTKMRATGWLEPGKRFLVTHEKSGKPVEGTLYSWVNGQWVGTSVDASIAHPASPEAKLIGGLKVDIREGENQPQLLVASEGGREGVLSEPDPALAGLWLAPQSAFSWDMPDGTRLTGGLTLPRDVHAGNRVPLVVQVDQYRPDLFLPDGGVATGAYTRQSMVAQGFAVLVLDAFHDMPYGLSEGPTLVDRFQAATGELIRLGIVDPDRVGLLGHSRNGYYTHYAITHPGPVRIKAAQIWDSVTQSFTDYLTHNSYSDDRWNFERFRGGSFWSNHENWLDQDVLFNVDKVQAATLLVEHGMPKKSQTAYGPSIPSVQVLGAYKLNDKPLEYLQMYASHTISQIHQRIPAQEVAIDWMRFWLKGETATGPDKIAQNERWLGIRKHEEARKQRHELVREASNPAITPQAHSDIPSESVLAARREMKLAGVDTEDPEKLNRLGYGILYDQRNVATAVQYFRWNLTIASSVKGADPRGLAQLQDSLAEGYIQMGDIAKARQNYAEAVARSPKYPGASAAVSIIERLKADPESLEAIQNEMRSAYEAATRVKN